MSSVNHCVLAWAAGTVLAFGALTASAGEIAGRGTFTGKSNHITTGGVSVVKTAGGGAVVILDTDFSLDGAPDPRVGLGQSGAYVEATDMGALGSNTGLQVYVVPAGVEIADYDAVYIWCRQFSVPLGVAALR